MDLILTPASSSPLGNSLVGTTLLPRDFTKLSLQ